MIGWMVGGGFVAFVLGMAFMGVCDEGEKAWLWYKRSWGAWAIVFGPFYIRSWVEALLS